jgi:gamma-glutamyltranspeptidase/glutathione hydrolase
MPARRLPAAVAAANSVTADVGARILRDGGSAADSAVAMVLASCVAETVFTGIAGGGFAVYVDAASGSTHCLDFFVAVPGLGGRRQASATEVAIDFGGQVVPYAVGAATVAVPGVPAGVAALHGRWGRLSWREVVEPAVRHARHGVTFAPLQAKVLATVSQAMLLGEGRRAYAREGKVLAGGGHLHHPGLDAAMQVLADDGAEAFYTGRVAESMVRAVGEHGDLSAADLAAYRVRDVAPRSQVWCDTQVQSRGDDLDDLLGTLAGLDPVEDDVETVRRLVSALRAVPRRGDTTSVAVTDADGNACAVTTSLGLSSGVWLPEYGIHLNSMLGEGELLRGQLSPGERMGSMMSPLVVRDDRGLMLVGGAAGGSRIRSALVQVLLGVVRRGLPVHQAVAAPRLNPVPGRVHVEPGFDDALLAALAEGDEVVRWPAPDSYFGGVSAVGRSGPGADPRRGGEVHLLG